VSRVLAVDTSSPWGGVAVVERAREGAVPVVLAEAGFRAPDHGRRLVGWLDALLRVAGIARDSIDLYVATRGPGSFTGLRIGLGTIRGLAVAAGRPCRGVGTLDALAEAHGPAEVARVPLLTAGRGELFGARFDATSMPPLAEVAPCVGPPASVIETTIGAGPAVAFGPGAVSCVDELREAGVRLAAPPAGIAAAAGRLALASNPGEDSMSPLYLRPPDALVGR